MQKVCIFLAVLLLPLLSLSQDFTSASEQESQLDEHGNFTNNITDKDGMRQGDWFYLDIERNKVAKKVFIDNTCESTHLYVNGEWLNTEELISNASYKTEAIKELNANGIKTDDDRQILVVFDESGDLLAGNLIGKWSLDEKKQVLPILKAYFTGLNLNSSSKTYILL